MLQTKSDFRLVVNAGGRSSRMDGAIKALLPVPPHDTPLVVTIVERLAHLSAPAPLVIANDPKIALALATSPYSVEVQADAWPNAGAIGGIATGLIHTNDWAIVVACDMPFVNPCVFMALCSVANEQDGQGIRRWDAIVPRVQGYPEMLHTLYHADLLPAFSRRIETRNLKLVDLLREVRVRYVGEDELEDIDPDLRSFTNVNTPQDWASALRDIEMTPGYGCEER